jgi:chromosomal replication initiation ATPase DnaA
VSLDPVTRDWLNDEPTQQLREIIIYAADLLFQRRVQTRVAVDDALASVGAAYVARMPPKRRIRESMASVAYRVASLYGLTVDDLRGRARERNIAHPRQHFMHGARDAGHSLPAIGRYLGGRDHTTVLHGARAHELRAEASRMRNAA